jgi:hypothetical protein
MADSKLVARGACPARAHAGAQEGLPPHRCQGGEDPKGCPVPQRQGVMIAHSYGGLAAVWPRRDPWGVS